ncbi:tRNA(His) guanylyltransferase [Plasmodiophora brassicae]|uniref:tRNA(His) guanylyltransferase n=1 Tax=Plasmodiophora brassicae TaxID=37360 RepID=A0A0G4INR7_PLABS|nr:hypothetical protein PBRA_005406 [Plasmodiophora brassicae]
MAKSRFEYVREFEQQDCLLKNAWIVVRIDGRGFHKFTSAHGFLRPNDARGLSLMNACAKAVMEDFEDIVIAYGHSDEFSFVINRHATVYKRRASKILSTIVSLFTARYVMDWPTYFPDVALRSTPMFDGRVVLYPTNENVIDYMKWRQADCHVNNLYNTTFWCLVLRGGRSNAEAERDLIGTSSADKNEIMFSRFSLNYNNEPAMFRKGSILVRYEPRQPDRRLKHPIIIHDDLIHNAFWSDMFPNVIR